MNWVGEIKKQRLIKKVTPYAFLVLFCLLTLPLNASAQEAAPSQERSPASAQQFEQWLRKNGYGASQAAHFPPSLLGQEPVLAAASPSLGTANTAVVVAVPTQAAPPPLPPPTLEETQQTMQNSVPPSAT